MKLTDNAKVLLGLRYFQPGEDWNALAIRVAKAIAAAEINQALKDRYTKEFTEIIQSGEFVPATPFLMNAGVSNFLFSCFVLPIKDSLAGIMQTASDSAKIFQATGGVGYCFSSLRPSLAPTTKSRGKSSGPVSFMKIYDKVCEVIKTNGRRGAQMGVMHISHPDIEEFINIKQDLTQLTNFNISCDISDEFMEAVEEDKEFQLHFEGYSQQDRKVSARALWKQIIHNAWKTGDPGLLFLDEANRKDPIGGIQATNPCGEVPMPPYSCCVLASIDLSKLVKNGRFDFDRFNQLTALGIRFLDDSIDVNEYTLPEIKERQQNERRIGLGIMGLADALIKLNLQYDSIEADEWCERLADRFRRVADIASQELAKEKGSFPLQDKSKLKDAAPIRNCMRTAIAPTGSISIIAGCSSSIEPIFALVYKRHHDLADHKTLYENNELFIEIAKERGFYTDSLMSRIAKNKGSCQGLRGVPKDVQKIFRIAADIDPLAHVDMLLTWQAFIDQSCSKTINLSNGATEDDIEAVYLKAHKGGAKGITVFRDGCRGGQQVFSTGEVHPEERPDKVEGTIHKVKTALGTMYITVGEVQGKPFEVFATLSKGGTHANADTEGLSRLVSLALRSHVPVVEIVKQLKGIGSGSSAFNKGKVVLSIPDAIAWILEKEYLDEKVRVDKDVEGDAPTFDTCIDCG